VRAGSIYALTTPEGTPFYVGRTLHPIGTRAGEHLRRARSGHSAAIYRLLRQTERVGLWELERGVRLDRLGARERFWQGAIAAAGFELFNDASDGRGCLCQPERTRERIATFAAGRDRDALGRYLPVAVE
jgi:hypothetical protein